MFLKLFTQILDSSIADNRRLRHFFTDFMLCADMRGYVIMTESAIARRIGTTVDEVEWGIAELEKPDPRSKTPDCEGRRIERLDGSGYGWRIINFESYKALKSAEEMREKTKARVQKFRESKKLQECNADVTPCNAGNTIKRQRQSKKQSETKKEDKTPSGEEDEVFEKWNSFDSLPKIVKVTDKRRAEAKTRLKESFFREHWQTGIAQITANPFMLGVSARGWKADIDWFLKPDSLIKIIEGKYNQTPPAQAGFTPAQASRHTPEHLAYCKRFGDLDPDSADANLKLPEIKF